MTIFVYAIIKGLRNKATLIFNCILPIVIILIRPLWDEGGLSGLGLLVMTMWGAAFLMSQGILNDKINGSITRILAAPVTMFQYLAQNLLAFMVPLTVQIAIVSVLGMILYDWGFQFALALFVCYAVFTASAIAMSFAWNCLFKSKDTSFSTFSAVITFGSALSGALIPLELFPTALQYLGAIFPAYWAVRGINAYLDYGAVLGYWSALLAMMVIAVICLFYGGKRRIV